MRDDELLRKFDAEMAECARVALAAPQGRDSFEYGKMCGLHAGLNRGRELVLTQYDEEDERER